MPWHPGVTGAPVLDDSLSYVEARVYATLEVDETTVVVADVVVGGRRRDGRHLTIEDVRAHLTADDWAAWEARRAQELDEAGRLRATRAAE
jgi:flavin reductase (DIM6/NTAB) family NADH-FMN oxidoreductase RutF